MDDNRWEAWKPATDQPMINGSTKYRIKGLIDQQIKIANHIANRQNENVEKFLPEEYVENTQLKNIVAVYY